jgi:osmotically inducible protein OsmC
MPVHKGKAVWEGTIKEGNGEFFLGDGKAVGRYSFGSRFENGKGSSPEELIGAAHAACFSMAFSLVLGNAGFTAKKIQTTAEVKIESSGQGFAITSIKLTTEGQVPGIGAEEFRRLAGEAKKNCPVSVALSAVPSVELEARLL